MTYDVLEKLTIIISQYASRIANDKPLNEDEALFYHQTLAYVRTLERNWEIGIELENREAEKRLWREDDDKDNGAGSTASSPTPPS